MGKHNMSHSAPVDVALKIWIDSLFPELFLDFIASKFPIIYMQYLKFTLEKNKHWDAASTCAILALIHEFRHRF